MTAVVSSPWAVGPSSPDPWRAWRRRARALALAAVALAVALTIVAWRARADARQYERPQTRCVAYGHSADQLCWFQPTQPTTAPAPAYTEEPD